MKRLAPPLATCNPENSLLLQLQQMNFAKEISFTLILSADVEAGMIVDVLSCTCESCRV
jgi:hypothetical protein